MKYQAPYGVQDTDASYVNGDPSIGRAGSIPPALAFEQPMRELVAIIQKSGLNPSDGDLKQALKAIRSGYMHFAEDIGSVNALNCVFDPVIDYMPNGFKIVVRIGHTNTSKTVTLTVGSSLTYPVKRNNRQPPEPYDLTAGMLAFFVFDQANLEWQIVSVSMDSYALMGQAGASGTGLIGGGGVGGTGTQGSQGIPGPSGPAGPAGPAGMMLLWARNTAGVYTFAVPSDVSRIYARVVGGGGGGTRWLQSESSQTGNAPGYSGTWAEGSFAVTPGSNITVTVGAGGAYGNDGGPYPGANGGTSSIGSLMTAPGGWGSNWSGLYYGPSNPNGVANPQPATRATGGTINGRVLGICNSQSSAGGVSGGQSFSVPMGNGNDGLPAGYYTWYAEPGQGGGYGYGLTPRGVDGAAYIWY